MTSGEILEVALLCDLDTIDGLVEFARSIAEMERLEIITMIERQKLPSGCTPEGEIASDWAYDALIELRDKVLKRGTNPSARPPAYLHESSISCVGSDSGVRH